MEISKTKIKQRLKRKTNPFVKETTCLALKHNAWLPLAKKLSGPTAKQISINLDELESKLKDKDIAVIAGKVLSRGELTKKAKIIALSFSAQAKEKLSKAKIPYATIAEEIISNPKAKGVVLICQDASSKQNHSQHLDSAQEQKKKRGGS